jgi:hypothetical protein
MYAKKSSEKDYALNLYAGEVVEVRSQSEILQTLDENGRLDALPFMPEMLKYQGKRFKIFKRADKTCDTIEKTGCRRMENAVHLEGVRCDGAAHGGCEAGCLLFWKEAWLKRVEPGSEEPPSENISPSLQEESSICTVETLMKATRSLTDTSDSEGKHEVFSCQATELRKATSYLPRWDYRHYLRDIRSGNRTISEVIGTIFHEIFAEVIRIKGYRIAIWTFNTIQRIRSRGPYPYIDGKLRKTPSAVLNLQSGELVQIKTHEEILQTLDTSNKNRGLRFDVEMVKYCGGIHRVDRKVGKIIDEKTGKMMELHNDCLILGGVNCIGDYHQLCPRSSLPYWREIWLKRVEEIKECENAEQM